MSELSNLFASAPAAGSDGAENSVQPLAQQDASLIRLDQFGVDARFSGLHGQGQTVVVLDTGINLDHPFFGADANSNGVADRIVHAYDFTGSNGGNVNDVNGHGSNVASIVGSQDAAYTGMAPGCNIIALKVLDNSGSGTFADIEEALQWVAANRATYNIVAVNMSLGTGQNFNGPTPLSLLSDEIAALKNNNVAVVCASGNNYYGYQSQGVSFPSSDPNAWSVGAVWDRNTGGSWFWSSGAIDYSTGLDRLISFSQRSTTMTTVFAPGGQIWGATADGNSHGDVWYMSGTSQASPHVAGLVALMQELAVRTSGHLMSVADLRSTMVSSAALIFDGDDENDNVINTNTNYPRVDVLAWGVAILNKLFAGTASNDTLNGTVVDDTIHGQGGNDRLDGGAGADVLIGGAGNDVYFVDNTGDAPIENAGEGNDTVYSTVHFRLAANVDNLILQGGADLQGYGNSEVNAIFGNSGSNILNGDVGADVMTGGAGNDAYFVDNAGDAAIENAGEGNDTVYSTVHFRLAANVDNLILQGSVDLQGYGNSEVNAIFGNSGSNILNGDVGADVMTGGAGNDAYFVDNAGDAAIENAGEGNDTVYSTVHFRLAANVDNLILQGSVDLQGYGNSMTNAIFGNDGVNLLDGGGSADVLTGDTGNDVFMFNVGQGDGDTIVDFSVNGALAGDSLLFVGYGAGANFTNIDATHWQVNYSGGASHDVITFTNGAAIDASDFAFV